MEVEWRSLESLIKPTSYIRCKEVDRTYRYIDLSSVSRDSGLISETSEITADNSPSRTLRLVEKDDVIFVTTYPTQQRLSVINDEYSGAVVSSGYCVLRANVEKVLPKWIYYHLAYRKFQHYIKQNQQGLIHPKISDTKVKEFQLPIPFSNDLEKSLAEQTRIVNILDKFAALTRCIIESTHREIELRKKQYEYCRRQLLSF